MPNAAVEELVVLLRRAIMAEVAQTASLRDELQPLCLAIAEYADRTGFALAAEDDEERLAATINESIMAQFAVGEPQEALIGSLMISAMYGALFHQNFAVQLGQWNLVDWPLAMQPIMAASYYSWRYWPGIHQLQSLRHRSGIAPAPWLAGQTERRTP